MKIYNSILVAFFILLFQGCGTTDDPIPGTEGGGETPGTEEPSPGNPGTEEPNPDDPVQILLHASGSEQMPVTRATPFPNTQQIAVIGAVYTPGTINWNSYPDINDEVATVAQQVDSTYYFNWANPKYWPLDGSQLVFLAYSPKSNGSSVQLSADRTELSLTLEQDMPDVMYASNNLTAANTPLTKSDSIVDLGEFRHVLSKVSIRLTAGIDMNPNVRLDTMLLVTGARTATFDLLGGDNALTLTPGEEFTFELTTTSQNFNTSDFKRDVYLYPGTHGDTYLHIRLTDGYFTVSKDYPISQFVNISNNTTDLTFERGVNTTLMLTVVGLEVEQPTDMIFLDGMMTEWYDAGDYEIIVK